MKEKSESLLGPGPQTTPAPKVPRQVPQKGRGGADDYLFKNAPPLEQDAFTREMKAIVESQMSVAQMQRRAVLEDSGPGEVKDARFITRLLEHKRRHMTPDGDLVVWCLVRPDELKMRVSAVMVPLDIKEELPKFQADNDEFLVRAVFKKLTVEEHRWFEPFITDVRSDTDHHLNFGQYRLLLFKRCFKSWNIPVELKHENGTLTDDAMNALEHLVNPRLVEEIGDCLITLNDLQKDEYDILERQAEQLFSKNNKKGVKHATDGIRDYCELTSLVKEMNVQVNELSWRDAQALRVVLGKRIESEKEQMQELEKNRKPSKMGRR